MPIEMLRKKKSDYRITTKANHRDRLCIEAVKAAYEKIACKYYLLLAKTLSNKCLKRLLAYTFCIGCLFLFILFRNPQTE